MPDSQANIEATLGTAWHVQGTKFTQQVGFISGSGSPSGVTTPAFIGQEYFDTANNVFYIAYGTANTDWLLVGTADTAAQLAFLSGVTAGTAAASKAVVADANKNVIGLGLFLTIEGAGATKTLTAADNGKVVQFDTAAGSVVTLPAATGSGQVNKFYVKTLATSNSHILYTASANGVGGSDVFEGLIPGSRVDSGDAVLAFAAASNSNTITLNRSTTGSVSLGEWLEVEDVATNVWQVKGFLSATGAAFATPFSHT